MAFELPQSYRTLSHSEDSASPCCAASSFTAAIATATPWHDVATQEELKYVKELENMELKGAKERLPN